MRPIDHRTRRASAPWISRILLIGFLAPGLAWGPAPQNALGAPPPARARERGDDAGTQALLARAQQY